ncbi:hypothetical protein [Rhodococcus wratislaviensis]|nr:hypothetical protein [Rhodococcus wratislaviensis]
MGTVGFPGRTPYQPRGARQRSALPGSAATENPPVPVNVDGITAA